MMPDGRGAPRLKPNGRQHLPRPAGSVEMREADVRPFVLPDRAAELLKQLLREYAVGMSAGWVGEGTWQHSLLVDVRPPPGLNGLFLRREFELDILVPRLAPAYDMNPARYKLNR